MAKYWVNICVLLGILRKIAEFDYNAFIPKLMLNFNVVSSRYLSQREFLEIPVYLICYKNHSIIASPTHNKQEKCYYPQLL